MRILGKYSFAGGEEYIHKKYPKPFSEIEEAIEKVDASKVPHKKEQRKDNDG